MIGPIGLPVAALAFRPTIDLPNTFSDSRPPSCIMHRLIRWKRSIASPSDCCVSSSPLTMATKRGPYSVLIDRDLKEPATGGSRDVGLDPSRADGGGGDPGSSSADTGARLVRAASAEAAS